MPTNPKNFFVKLLDLREGADDKKTIIENVKDDSDFTSVRFWILVSAVLVASVGLNMNSIPVIIGAMLISPLMGPIVSMGVALSTYDWGLMRRSFRNFLLLTAIGIIISTLYFALSPISNAQSELLARTQPTIFDVLIAVFGGIAGFIGVSRARSNTVVPGVAIATALMPPLCTIGYGLGTWQASFIFGAGYLYLINSIFICISVLIVATYMKLPKKEYPDAEKKKKVNRVITTVTTIIVLPAIYLAYTFVQQNDFNQNAMKYVTQEFAEAGHVVIYQNLIYDRYQPTIELAILGERFTENDMRVFEAKLSQYGLVNTKLFIRQDSFALSEEEWNLILTQVQNDDQKISTLEARVASERASFMGPTRVYNEAKALNENITDVAIGTVQYGLTREGEKLSDTVILVKTSGSLTQDEGNKIIDWLKQRLEVLEPIIYFSPELQIEEVVEIENEQGR